MNYAELNRAIEASGLKRSHIAKQMGIGQNVLCDRMKGGSEWKVKDVLAFCRALNLGRKQMNEIFFDEM